MPRGLTAAQKSALTGRIKSVAHFMSLVLPGGTTRAWTGIGDVYALGATWVGVGEMMSISDLSTSTEQRAQQVSVTLAGIPRDAVPGTLISNSRSVRYQGAALTLYAGVLDPTTGVLVGDPLAVWAGLADTVTFSLGETITATLTGDQLSSQMKRSNGLLMTPESHNFRLGNPFPRDTFFDFQTQLMGAPRPAFS